MKNNKIKRVIRAGGLVETNSSSSHALCICGDEDAYAKPGDIEFDLDIHDDTLFIPNRNECFGWEYEKSNSCCLKLQYVCGLFFAHYSPLKSQKKPHKLVTILKNYLGVKKVVFEWEEEYKKLYNSDSNRDIRLYRDDTYISSPDIDHNSYTESYDDIMESKETIIDFIFNKKSWYFGGNDNSDAPRGFYKEMRTDDKVPNSTLSINYPDIGRVDFRIDLFRENPWKGYSGSSYKVDEFDDEGLFRSIVYKDGKFCIDKELGRLPSDDELGYFTDYIDPKDNKLKFLYCKAGLGKENIVDLSKGLSDGSLKPHEVINKLAPSDYVLVEGTIVNDEFGKIV